MWYLGHISRWHDDWVGFEESYERGMSGAIALDMVASRAEEEDGTDVERRKQKADAADIRQA